MSFDSNPDPGRTLGQFGIAVLALVVGAALLFLAIDRFSDDPVASPQPSPSVTASTAPTDTPTAAATETPAESPPASETPSASETDTDTETPSAEPSPAATSESSTQEPSPSEEPTEDETDDSDGDRIDPGEISIQVLDAIKDGAGQARDIADEMEADGYRVVAYNPSSIIYDETTVFYTEGYEDEANQVADDYGWDEVVFNDILSEDVNVHVVVGLDEQ
ncbi:LytR C-terminal domain-containing protein [Salsipaludibacter albus]|uniref:LytR C-terminal domain-containing protein n=1 Tax=Salsipaludibacter albus TaxID=2849650 RepID=UPI001EE41803|nr:LytR C-terminal domain-containing protein [Salsipaludibacter albus]MBY5160931.1 LytR C-terminal domain-containing protein [Salsipaludibacter albus]